MSGSERRHGMTYDELCQAVESIDDALCLWMSWQDCQEDDTEERRSGLTFAELTASLGSHELALGVWKRWGHSPPSDPEALRRYAARWSRYEHQMRGYNSDLNAGRITERQYNELEEVAYKNALNAT